MDPPVIASLPTARWAPPHWMAHRPASLPPSPLLTHERDARPPPAPIAPAPLSPGTPAHESTSPTRPPPPHRTPLGCAPSRTPPPHLSFQFGQKSSSPPREISFSRAPFSPLKHSHHFPPPSETSHRPTPVRAAPEPLHPQIVPPPFTPSYSSRHRAHRSHTSFLRASPRTTTAPGLLRRLHAVPSSR
jgi:hypothetical protein